MKTDDFENRLARQPLRGAPAEWREEILARTRASLPRPATVRESEWFAGLRLLLSRIPAAWGAVALLWAVILGVNGVLTGSAPASSSAAGPMEPLTTLTLQRAEIDRLVELSPSYPEPAQAPAAPPVPASPRTERRLDEDLGEFRGGTPALMAWTIRFENPSHIQLTRYDTAILFTGLV